MLLNVESKCYVNGCLNQHIINGLNQLVNQLNQRETHFKGHRK